MDMDMNKVTIVKQAGSTLAEQVTSLEEGYAELLQENGQLGEQQEITRQAYQNLLHEKDTTIAGLDATVAAKLKHITLLDEALTKARECNATLDHRLELAHRQTATSVRIEGDKDRDNPLGDPPLERTGPVLRYGDVRLARHIFNNLHYPAIRALLGMEACRMLDAALRADREVSD